MTVDGLISNPRLFSFNLMKLDINQSCRVQCAIEKKTVEGNQANDIQGFNVIGNSPDQIEVLNAEH